MAKFNFVKTSETRISLEAKLKELRACEEHLCKGGFSQYSTLGEFHKDIRKILSSVTQSLAEEVAYEAKFSQAGFDKPIDYPSTTDKETV
jgi:hypothetical protein